MKKFLEFIWILISPIIEPVVGILIVCLAMIWVFTGFGILIIFAPNMFPTPEWVRWSVIVFDVLCIVIIIYGRIQEAYNRVYKN